MSTFCCDYVNGSDNNGGDSWGNPVLSGTDGVADGTTTFTSASGGFTGKENRWICIVGEGTYKINSVTDDTTVVLSSTVSSGTGLTFHVGGAKQTINGCTAAMLSPGDTVKLAKSPDPTSLSVNGTWTNGPIPAQKYITATADNGSGLVRVTVSSHGYNTGDTVQILNVFGTVEANGTWRVTYIDGDNFDLQNSSFVNTYLYGGTAQNINSKCVKLASALTQTICNCESDWTPGVNVTSAAVNAYDFKQGGSSITINAAAGHAGAGILAQFGLPMSLDLSSKNQLSFWLKDNYNAWGTPAFPVAGNLKIKLYSDTACTIEVESFDVPGIPSTGRWIPITIDKGSALSATVQGIAVYANIAMPSAIIYVDNFIACKDSSSSDSLTLQSLISKNSLATGGTEGFYGIQAIDGTIVTLDNDTNTLGNAGLGYSGASETAPVYKREAFKTAMVAHSFNIVQEIQNSGTAGILISFEGGYNPATNIQGGETFFDGLNGNGVGLYAGGKSFVYFNKLAVARYDTGVWFGSSHNCSIGTLSNANNNTTYGVFIQSPNCTIRTLGNANNNYAVGVLFSSAPNCTIGTLVNANNNAGMGVYLGVSPNCTIGSLGNANNNFQQGVCFASGSLDCQINTGSTASNGISGIYNDIGAIYLRNFTINDAVEVSGFTSFADARICSQKRDGILGNNWIFTDGGTINSLANDLGSTLGLKWRFCPTSLDRSSAYPLKMKLSPIAVNNGSLVTFSLKLKKSHATEIAASLVIPGMQIAGVDTDVVTPAPSDTVDNQLTVTFTPTEAGTFHPEVWVWIAGTSLAEYVDTHDCNYAQA